MSPSSVSGHEPLGGELNRQGEVSSWRWLLYALYDGTFVLLCDVLPM
ncbi:MAG: hypothetical protein LC794_03420 [Acidobacteria bacterium]|nr:hypothetical protein [Acidobacteriota bacterium]